MNKIRQWFTNTVTFFAEVKAEWAKVTTPARQEVIATTLVVIITSVVFAVYLWAADVVIYWAYQGVTSMIDKVGNVLSS